MKRTKYLSLPAAKADGYGVKVTAQYDSAERILIMDVLSAGKHEARYLLNTETGEHHVYDYGSKSWHAYSIVTAAGFEKVYAYGSQVKQHIDFLSETDMKTAYRALKIAKERSWYSDKEEAIWSQVMYLESNWCSEKHEAEREKEVQRYKTMVESVPELPADFSSWARGLIAPQEYALKSEEKGKLYCTACGKLVGRRHLKVSGRQAAQGETAPCPECGAPVIVKPRSSFIEERGMVSILQDIDEKKSVARFIDVGFSWTLEGKKTYHSDAIWIFLLRNDPRFGYRIVYNQYRKEEWYDYGSFWKSNTANRRVTAGYMYPGGIEEALRGTDYQTTARLIRAMADGKAKLNYNRVLAAFGSRGTLNMLEYLFKGRFFRLLAESVENIGYWEGQYMYGPLDKDGMDIKEVFGISDQQKINRIRDVDGGGNLVEWMQLADITGEKIPQETLAWLAENGIRKRDLRDVLDRMSVTKIANYVKKQQATGYKGKTATAVLGQWFDYLSMCREEKKNLDDDMVFRPRELKRRHDEIAQEINHRKMMEELKRSKERAAEEAKRMREKFPGAEEVLHEIKNRFEYSSGDYMIIVPQSLMDITSEGIALHHCVGSSDRYFERIRNHETYVCFLRKKAEPEAPYYTIEVEPGGTVRQHRGYLDEEPEIEKVKPFIREWQAVLKKRLTAEDRKRAKKSAVLRQQNIDELKAKNNKRVLDGLMEDLMEAEAV